MKKQLYDLIIILIFFLLIFIKDEQSRKMGNISLIRNNLNYLLEYKLEEYDNLAKVNNLKNIYDYKCLTSIKSFDTNDFYKYITLYNNGCNASNGDLVMNSDGLIGLVDHISQNTMKVILITNSKFSISIKVGNLYGTIHNKYNNLIIDDIEKPNLIKTNDIVYTSGLTSIPRNIPVGKIKEVQKNKLIVESFYDNQNPYVIIIGVKS